VVADAILASGMAQPIGFFDDDPDLAGRSHFGLPVLGTTDRWKDHTLDMVAMGIGDNKARARQFEALKRAGAPIVTVLHPRATIGSGARIGEGTVVFAHVVVNADAVVDENCILNTACTVDHDCIVGPHVHLAPGAKLAGNVRVGAGAFLGMGVSVLPRRLIGEWAIVGAGAVVVANAPAHKTVRGVPARAG
jgi:sugar O-acyltransferase (sialic acid O-acetyltransferase NeuD family)